MKKILGLIIIFFYSILTATSQQIPDTLFLPILPKNTKSKVSIVYIDEAHNNFHTKNNRFLPFAKLLRQDGYKVKGFTNSFTKQSLENIKVLVISNALVTNARQPFVRPTKSAFTKQEIKVLNTWVKQGGSLFLIADHMPFAGAASKLGKSFGFHFYDSFLFDENNRGIIDFSLENKRLKHTKITKGNNELTQVKSIRTFTGQAFKIPKEAKSILDVKKKDIVQIPDTMWVFNEKTKKISGKGLSQGAFLEYGKGRLVVFGEAAMFTAQLAGRDRIKVGMNSEEAKENYKLLLNIIHWLDRLY